MKNLYLWDAGESVESKRLDAPPKPMAKKSSFKIKYEENAKKRELKEALNSQQNKKKGA